MTAVCKLNHVAIDCEIKFRAQVCSKFSTRIRDDFHRRELPHPREQIAIAIELPHEQRAAARVKQDGGGKQSGSGRGRNHAA